MTCQIFGLANFASQPIRPDNIEPEHYSSNHQTRTHQDPEEP